MIYHKIMLSHNHADLPIESISELDEERWELRRIELYRDGSLRLLGPWPQSDDALAENAFSADHLIEQSSAIKVIPTSQEEFEQRWRSALISSAA